MKWLQSPSNVLVFLELVGDQNFDDAFEKMIGRGKNLI